MFFRTAFLSVAVLGSALFSIGADAGIVLSGTRLIYDGSVREASITHRNTSDVPYVVQTWVESQDGGMDTPFFVTPALSRVEGGKEGLLRVLKVGGALPEDRESMFWLNVKEIPKADSRDNVLQIAVRTRIKLFYRPAGLKPALRGPTLLKWRLRGQAAPGQCVLAVNNTSAYHMTFAEIKVGDDQKTESLNVRTLAPFSTDRWHLARCAENMQVNYSFVNDFGATDTAPAVPLRLIPDLPRDTKRGEQPTDPL